MEYLAKIRPICVQLEAILRCRTRNPLLAEELVEDAASTCWYRWKDKDAMTLRKLMFRVAWNSFLNHVKKQKRERKDPLKDLDSYSAPGLPSDYSDAQQELLVDLDQCLKLLPINLHEVVDRRYFRNETIREAARSMGRSVSTVKRWQSRALEKLRRLLQASS